MTRIIYLFQNAIRDTNMEPPKYIEYGKFYRFPGVGKPRNNRAGWCTLFHGGLGGCFGDWSSNFSETWCAQPNKHFSQAERTAFWIQSRKAHAQAKADEAAKHFEAAKKASRIWDAAAYASYDYAYLLNKKIHSYGAKIYKGALVLPVVDFEGNIHGLQFIHANGSKYFLSGTRKRGCFILVAGTMSNPSRIIICEGWATGCTLAEHEPSAIVLAAIDAGNLEIVAVSARRRWPMVEIIIAGDDDRLTPNNPGATKAHAAAIAANALLALPQWPSDAPENLTDFNDLAIFLQGG